jgi:hypothetical protein
MVMFVSALRSASRYPIEIMVAFNPRAVIYLWIDRWVDCEALLQNCLTIGQLHALNMICACDDLTRDSTFR